MKSFKYILTTLVIALVALSSCSKHKRSTRHSGGDPDKMWVDIGTVVDGKKVYWATCNLGAENPWEYGNFYSWGELEPKSSYTFETLVYKDTPEYLPLTADAANKALGGKWRIPKVEDFIALFDLGNNENYLFEQFGTFKDKDGNDVKGIKITQKSTGKVLFLPAAGYYEGEQHYYAGEYGQYWTPKFAGIYGGRPESMAISISEGMNVIGSVDAFRGISIRPVLDD